MTIENSNPERGGNGSMEHISENPRGFRKFKLLVSILAGLFVSDAHFPQRSPSDSPKEALIIKDTPPATKEYVASAVREYKQFVIKFYPNTEKTNELIKNFDDEFSQVEDKPAKQQIEVIRKHMKLLIFNIFEKKVRDSRLSQQQQDDLINKFRDDLRKPLQSSEEAGRMMSQYIDTLQTLTEDDQ